MAWILLCSDVFADDQDTEGKPRHAPSLRATASESAPSAINHLASRSAPASSSRIESSTPVHSAQDDSPCSACSFGFESRRLLQCRCDVAGRGAPFRLFERRGRDGGECRTCSQRTGENSAAAKQRPAMQETIGRDLFECRRVGAAPFFAHDVPPDVEAPLFYGRSQFKRQLVTSA